MRLILTYAIHTRAETIQKMYTVETKVLRTIKGITLRERLTNSYTQEQCTIEKIG